MTLVIIRCGGNATIVGGNAIIEVRVPEGTPIGVIKEAFCAHPYWSSSQYEKETWEMWLHIFILQMTHRAPGARETWVIAACNTVFYGFNPDSCKLIHRGTELTSDFVVGAEDLELHFVRRLNSGADTIRFQTVYSGLMNWDQWNIVFRDLDPVYRRALHESQRTTRIVDGREEIVNPTNYVGLLANNLIICLLGLLPEDRWEEKLLAIRRAIQVNYPE